jgi:hypothetical protein
MTDTDAYEWDEHPAFADRPQREPQENTTFAQRSARPREGGAKRVDPDEEIVEDKAVPGRRATTKRRR